MTEATQPPRHLVSVWNPAHAVDAHVAKLVERAKAPGREEIDEEEWRPAHSAYVNRGLQSRWLWASRPVW